jgi:hypothetical protein
MFYLLEDAMDDHRREALLAEYGEVSNNFRLLTDIRFKLLAFLPLATAAGAALKGDSLGIGKGVLSLFGLAATIGLITYNARNDQLYNELVGRAASIERSLGIPDGAFANRPTAWLTIRFLGFSWPVNHGQGVGVIYKATIALWLFGLLAPIIEFARRAYLLGGLPHFVVTDPAAFVQILALAFAIFGTLAATNSIELQMKVRDSQMRLDAACAVKKALSKKLSEIANDNELISLCVKLSNGKAHIVKARAEFFAAIDPESIGHYLASGSAELAASSIVAILTDLPQRWLFDCFSNRRGNVQDAPTKASSPV